MKDIKNNLTLDNADLLKNDSENKQMKKKSQNDNKINNVEINNLMNKNQRLDCSKFEEKSKLETIKYIILNNNKIQDIINRIHFQIDNIVKNFLINSLYIQLNDITQYLFLIMEGINTNNEIIFKILNNKNNGINNNMTIISTNLNYINTNK